MQPTSSLAYRTNTGCPGLGRIAGKNHRPLRDTVKRVVTCPVE